MTATVSAPAMLEIDGLVAGYGGGAPVLHGLTLSVPRGAITAVLGANGAGKTTLLRTVSGLVKPTAGRVVLDGSDLRGVPVERLVQRGMAHVPEGQRVTELTVDEPALGGLCGAIARPALRWPRCTTVPAARPAPAARRSPASGGSGRCSHWLRPDRLADAVALDSVAGLAPKVTADHGVAGPAARPYRSPPLLVEQNVRSALSVADRGVMSLGCVVVATESHALRDYEDLRHAYLGF
jgi:branched-chain amino acid transport system ATP-binding protein